MKKSPNLYDQAFPKVLLMIFLNCQRIGLKSPFSLHLLSLVSNKTTSQTTLPMVSITPPLQQCFTHRSQGVLLTSRLPTWLTRRWSIPTGSHIQRTRRLQFRDTNAQGRYSRRWNPSWLGTSTFPDQAEMWQLMKRFWTLSDRALAVCPTEGAHARWVVRTTRWPFWTRRQEFSGPRDWESLTHHHFLYCHLALPSPQSVSYAPSAVSNRERACLIGYITDNPPKMHSPRKSQMTFGKGPPADRSLCLYPTRVESYYGKLNRA